MKKLLPLILSLFILISFGCGKNQPAGDQDQKKTEEIKTDNKTPDKVTDNTKKDEGKQDGNDLGMKSGLPEDFPKDIPVPQNSTCHGSIYNQSEGTTVTFVVKGKPADIVNFYKAEMTKSGFIQEQGSEDLMNDKGGMIKWNKDKRAVEMMMSYKPETNETDLVLSYKDKK
ncbi:MAG: hypothetical protein LWX07_04805 [Bacteroidetes bacterium]|nr:hypothetical protein [Bacteroidota bacterium]